MNKKKKNGNFGQEDSEDKLLMVSFPNDSPLHCSALEEFGDALSEMGFDLKTLYGKGKMLITHAFSIVTLFQKGFFLKQKHFNFWKRLTSSEQTI